MPFDHTSPGRSHLILQFGAISGALFQQVMALCGDSFPLCGPGHVQPAIPFDVSFLRCTLVRRLMAPATWTRSSTVVSWLCAGRCTYADPVVLTSDTLVLSNFTPH